MSVPPPDPPSPVDPVDFFKNLKETKPTRWAEVYASWVSIASGGGIGTNRRQRLRVDNDELVAQTPVDEASSRYSPWVMTTHPSGWVEVMDGNVDHITGYLVGLRDPDGVLLWTWRHPDADFTMDAAVATDGTVYAVTDASRTVGPQSEVGLTLTRINGVTGVGVDIVTIWPDDLPTPPYGGTTPEMTPVSVALSADGSVAYILAAGATTWSNPGIQTLIGVDTQTGGLLWQHLLERERPGYYYGIYNYYDGAQVRTVPGEDTCYVHYDTFVTVNEWKSLSLGRIEFPNGPRQQPIQAWTRLPFSVEEIDQFSQWAGPRSLTVTGDGVVVGVEQGFDTPEPVRLILKYDHAGELKWTWGEIENLEMNAAITANSIAVAGGLVFFGYDFGEATPLFPERAGMGALDYETGEFLGLGYFPVDTYWEGKFAAYGEVIPPPELQPPTDYFKNLEFPCPPLEFYAYGIDGDNNFFLARYQADGTAKWYYNATWYEGDDPVNFPNQNDQLSDSLNAWPGYGGGSSTLDGYFAHAIDGVMGANNKYGFYHVGPDKEYLGYKMMLPIGVSPDGARGGWGQEAARDADGDHYACYYNYPYAGEVWDNVVVVGWRGTGASAADEKWRITQSQIPDPYSKSPVPGSITLAPDGTTLIIAYSEGIYQGVNKDSGAVLWTFSFRDPTLAKDAEWMMENTVRAVFAPQGHLLLDVEMAHYIIYPDEGFGEYWQADSVYGAVVRLDFPYGYDAMPVVAWETDVGADLTPCWLVGLDDGGAIMNSLSTAGMPMLVRVNADGSIAWNNDISEELVDASWDEPYAPMVLIGDRVHAGIVTGHGTKAMIPFSIETGLSDVRDGEDWPLDGTWQIGAPAVLREPSPDCRPLPTDYFKNLKEPEPQPPVDTHGLILGVGVGYWLHRLNAVTGEDLDETYLTPGSARSYMEGGPGGEESEIYVTGDDPFASYTLNKYVGRDLAWRLPLSGGLPVGLATVDAPADGSAIGVNFDQARVGLVDPTTGATLIETALPAGRIYSRDMLLAPDGQSAIIFSPRSGTFIMRIAFDGTVMWQKAAAFTNADTVYLRYHGGYVYLQYGTVVRRHDIATGDVDGSWSFSQSGNYAGVEPGKGPSDGRIFVGNNKGVRSIDIATLTQVFSLFDLYGQIHYLLAGPDGEVYAATKTYQEQDERMRVYRIEADGTVTWTRRLPHGLGTANSGGGLALSYGRVAADAGGTSGSGVIDFFTGNEA